MRISEVSRRSGVSASALRYYESIGLISPQRARNGYRDYDAEVLSRLDLIEASKGREERTGDRFGLGREGSRLG